MRDSFSTELWSTELWPVRIVFGCGTLASLPAELDALGAERLVVLTSAARRASGEALARSLGARAVGVLAEALPHVPREAAEHSVQRAVRLGARWVVAVGGGSTLGLGKVLAARTAARLVAVPTTYCGSELTDVYGITADGEKRTTRDPAAGASLVVYDPVLTLSLPVAPSVTSAFNALAHATAQLYTPGIDPAFAAVAEEALRTVVAALPGVVAAGAVPTGGRDAAQVRPGAAGGHPSSVDAVASAEEPLGSAALTARSALMRGAYLAALALRQGLASGSGFTLHHKLCHLIGGSAGLPHAGTHTVFLPQVLHFLRPAIAPGMERIARALGGLDPAVGSYDLALRCGAPVSLAELGLDAGALGPLVDAAMGLGGSSPRELRRPEVERLLEAAFLGLRPEW